MHKIQNMIFMTPTMKVCVGVRMKSANTNSKYQNIEGFQTKSGYIVLKYQPAMYIEISAGKSTINFRVDEYVDILFILKKVYKAIRLDDMYFLEDAKSERIIINSELAKKHKVFLQSFNDNIVITPSLVKRSEHIFEGCLLNFNNETSIGDMTFDELKKLIKILNRVDLHNYALTLSNSALLMSMQKYPLKIQETEEIEYTTTDNNSFDILKTKKETSKW